MLRKVNFVNRKAGRPRRAAWWLRAGRMIRRKRVAYARAHAWSTLEQAKRQMAKFEKLAARHNVPIDPIQPLPDLPHLPGRDWVEHLRHMGDLKPPVKPAPPVEGVPA